MHTAGQDNPEVWGNQVVLEDNPFWDDFVPAFLHSLSPIPIIYEDFEWMGEMYQPAWYGDSEYYMQFDWIKVFAPLGLYDKSKKNVKRLEAIRWIQTHIPPGGMEGLITERLEDSEHFLDAIFYFLLDPIVTPPADPRPDIALEHFAPGLGRLLARTSWEADAAWFAYNLGWLIVDHQHSDNNHFEFYPARRMVDKRTYWIWELRLPCRNR